MNRVYIHVPTQALWDQVLDLCRAHGFDDMKRAKNDSCWDKYKDESVIDVGKGLSYFSARDYYSKYARDAIIFNAATQWPDIFAALGIKPLPMKRIHIITPTQSIFDAISLILLSKGFKWYDDGTLFQSYHGDKTQIMLGWDSLRPKQLSVLGRDKKPSSPVDVYVEGNDLGAVLDSLKLFETPPRPVSTKLDWKINSYDVEVFADGRVRVGCTTIAEKNFARLVAESHIIMSAAQTWDTKHSTL